MPRGLRVAAFSLPPAPSLCAQFRSGFQGTVVDRSSAVVPGVTVRVINLSTGVAREAVTSDEGVYRVSSLTPGTYKISAIKSGFASTEQNSVVLAADEIRKVDF